MKVNIISYLGEGDLRTRRHKVNLEQLQWFLNKGIEANQVCQNYSEQELSDVKQYTKSIIETKKILPGEARNLLLENFYSSNEPMSIFADNDSWLMEGEKYGCVDTFLEDVKRNIDKVPILFWPINGLTTPYTKTLARPEQKEYLIFTRTSAMRGCLFFLKNNKSKVMFDNENYQINNEILGGEDGDFLLQNIVAGNISMMCSNIILKDKCTAHSTWAPDTSMRTIQVDRWNEVLIKKYGYGRGNLIKLIKPLILQSEVKIRRSAEPTALESLLYD